MEAASSHAQCVGIRKALFNLIRFEAIEKLVDVLGKIYAYRTEQQKLLHPGGID